MAKYFLISLVILAAFAAYESHDYTMGIQFHDVNGANDEDNYNNLNYQSNGNVDILIRYTTQYLKDYSTWHDLTVDPTDNRFDVGWESDFDTFYDDEMNQLYLEFDIFTNIDANPALTGSDEVTRCLVCMNVDEDSELRSGDKGFAACYKTETGSYFNAAGTAINNDDPEWVFIGEVKAINKGTAVKATDNNGWTNEKWNKNTKTAAEKCTWPGVSGDLYYL